jgi:CHAD domain-containing protein
MCGAPVSFVKTPPTTLDLPADRGIRLVALDLLDRVDAAGARLSLPDDPDALHDFRVALRRLRSWLRAFRTDLKGAVRRKDRRALREVADATNVGRDLEVELAWLARTARGFRRTRKHGAEWLAQYLEARRRATNGAGQAEMLDRFARTRKRLIDRLGTIEVPVREPEVAPPTLAHAIGERLAPHFDALATALRVVETVDDDEAAHDARIAAKRLRYLIEPLAQHTRQAVPILKVIRSLQQQLGELHDAHVIARELRAVLTASASTEADRIATRALGVERSHAGGEGDDAPELSVPSAVIDPAPSEGLLALADRLGDETVGVFEVIRKTWLADDRQIMSLQRSVTRLALSLAAPR